MTTNRKGLKAFRIFAAHYLSNGGRTDAFPRCGSNEIEFLDTTRSTTVPRVRQLDLAVPGVLVGSRRAAQCGMTEALLEIPSHETTAATMNALAYDTFSNAAKHNALKVVPKTAEQASDRRR